jgi:hypothetical protein
MEKLATAIKNGDIMLFAGAGVSMNLGLPSLAALIDHIAKELEYDPDVYRTLGDFYALAEYYRIKKGSVGPLRSWMDQQWHSSNVQIENSKIHQLICSLQFPIIYTTNYDRWLERAFEFHGKDYLKIALVADLTKIKDHQTQIVKFHGDFDDDNSIVLTQTSYFERLEFETPLDIKLRSDVLGKGVLFIGYSLSDINLRFIFYKLSKMWQNVSLSDVRPQSFIFYPQPNVVQKAIFKEWGIKMITSEKDNLAEALEEFLTKLLG